MFYAIHETMEMDETWFGNDYTVTGKNNRNESILKHRY